MNLFMNFDGRKIGVGFVGASPDRGWALNAHVPALKTLPGFEIRAVSTTKMASAQAAAAAFGAKAAYDDARALAADPDVDLLVVTVKVPSHLDVVSAAIEAGKAVFCEWPLGNGLGEAVELDRLAKAKGVPNFVGLQARCAPAIAYLRDLLAEGYVGTVLSTTLVGSGGGWGTTTSAADAYVQDVQNGATMVTIPFGHTVDTLCDALGEFKDLAAVTTVHYKEFTVAETGERRPKTAADQLAVVGTLESGAVAALHYRGGVSRGTNLMWEINGTDGDLQVTGPVGHLQLTELTLRGGRGEARTLDALPVPDRYFSAKELPTLAIAVAELYGRIERDLREGTATAPDFEVAVRRHRMLSDIENAAESGQWVGPSEVPFL